MGLTILIRPEIQARDEVHQRRTSSAQKPNPLIQRGTPCNILVRLKGDSHAPGQFRGCAP